MLGGGGVGGGGKKVRNAVADEGGIVVCGNGRGKGECVSKTA